MAEVPAGSFTPKATKFFAGLERNNSKDYWTANKAIFENEVKEPMAALVESLPERFGPFKIFRMNRDIRFSHDKSPYKTQHGAAHEVDGTVYYVHLDASGLMAACGAYMMAPDQLERYREAVEAETHRWCAARHPGGPQRAWLRGRTWHERAAQDRAPRISEGSSPRRPAATEGGKRASPIGRVPAPRRRCRTTVRHRYVRRLGPMNDWIKINIGSSRPVLAGGDWGAGPLAGLAR